MYYLYILKCADDTLYTGITTDLERRVYEHNTSNLGARYTSARRPVRLVYSKKFKDRSSASKEEARIKKLKKDDKIKIIKSHTWKRENYGLKKS
jgi:putative endonuclease